MVTAGGDDVADDVVEMERGVDGQEMATAGGDDVLDDMVEMERGVDIGDGHSWWR